MFKVSLRRFWREKLRLSATGPLKRESRERNRISLPAIVLVPTAILAVYGSAYALFRTDADHLVNQSRLVSRFILFLQSFLQPLEIDLLDLWILAIFVFILLILERYWPADDFSGATSTGSDLTYTIIESLGVTGLALYLLVSPVMDSVQSYLTSLGIPFLNLSHILKSHGVPLLASALFLVFIFDGFDTLRHRLEHRFSVLWAFHSIHHSQTRMTFMNLNRAHVVSRLFSAFCYSAVGRFLGVHIDEMFAVLVAYGFVAYLTHANVRLSYGPWLNRLIVCPLYHRTHHASVKAFSQPPYGCNFAFVFPFWDMIMGTADFSNRYTTTGIYGETATQVGKSYWGHQLRGIKKFMNVCFKRRSRIA